MDVPFSSSGALSRAHYAIVRKVESATSSQAADQHLAAEIKSIRRQLAHPALDLVRNLLLALAAAWAEFLLESMQRMPDHSLILFHGHHLGTPRQWLP